MQVPEKNPLENEDEAWAKRAKFKSNLTFVGLLDQYIDNISERVFSAKDYTYQGHVVPALWLNDRFCAYKTIPVKKRLDFVAEVVLEDLLEVKEYFRNV